MSQSEHNLEQLVNAAVHSRPSIRQSAAPGNGYTSARGPYAHDCRTGLTSRRSTADSRAEAPSKTGMKPRSKPMS